MSAYSSSTNPGIWMFDLDKLKDILAKQGIDFERAIFMDDGEAVEVTDEFEQVEIFFAGTYTPGSRGSWDEPPYESEVEISDVSDITFSGKTFDISGAISKKGWESMELAIAECYSERYEPPRSRYGRRWEED